MSKRIRGSIGRVFSVLGVVTVALLAGSSQATTWPGNAGRAQDLSQQSCFTTDNWGAMTQTCTGSVMYTIPIPNPATSGNHSFTAKVLDTDAQGHKIWCEGIVVDSGGGLHATTAAESVPNSGYQWLSFGPLFASATSSLQIVCSLSHFTGTAQILQASGT